MAKWYYLRRAYAIQEYAYLRQTEAENVDLRERTDEQADTLPCVIEDIKDILSRCEDSFISWRETPEDGRTIRQCKKFLNDFASTNKT